VACTLGEPLKVMISGAPASGKGTQCKMIVEKVLFLFNSFYFLPVQNFFAFLNLSYFAVWSGAYINWRSTPG
jgi:hypothetical protein